MERKWTNKKLHERSLIATEVKSVCRKLVTPPHNADANLRQAAL